MAKDLYTEPCPSPNGTNYERLYIIRQPAIMAMDQAVGGPMGSPNYASYNTTDDIDLDTPDSSGDDLSDKIHQLLAGKLDDADIDALCALLDPDKEPAPPAQDRKRGRQAHDRRPAMPSRAEILRRVAASGEVRAQRVLEQNAKLMERFPALKNARVA
jgi:hypothetical protein